MRRFIKTAIPIIMIIIIIVSIIIELMPVYPPTRIGETTHIAGTPEKIYSFETALKEAEVIAHIKIGDWLGQDEWYSYYEASLIDNYKGDISGKFIIRQRGTSKSTQNCYPLFINGNEIVLLMNKVEELTEYENLYRICYETGGVFYMTCDDTNNTYLYDKFLLLQEISEQRLLNSIPYDSYAKKMYDKLLKDGSILEEIDPGIHYFYKIEDFVELISSSGF